MSQTQQEKNPARVTTNMKCVARLSYPYLFRPAKPMNGEGEGKYQCELIFEPDADLSALRAAANYVAKEKWGDKIPKGLKSPFRNGTEAREGKPEYEGRIFIGARSKSQPDVLVGVDRRPAQDKDIYGGIYVLASLTAFAYDQAGNKGVAFALNGILKLRDGEAFGSGGSAKKDFESLEIDEEAFGDTGFDTSAFEDSPLL